MPENHVDVVVPAIGDFDDVEVIEVLVAVGDRVEVEQSLITLESDKATMEIPSPRAGVVRELLVELGALVSEGALILRLEVAAAAEASTAEEPAVAPGSLTDEAPGSLTDEAPGSLTDEASSSLTDEAPSSLTDEAPVSDPSPNLPSTPSTRTCGTCGPPRSTWRGRAGHGRCWPTPKRVR